MNADFAAWTGWGATTATSYSFTYNNNGTGTFSPAVPVVAERGRFSLQWRPKAVPMAYAKHSDHHGNGWVKYALEYTREQAEVQLAQVSKVYPGYDWKIEEAP